MTTGAGFQTEYFPLAFKAMKERPISLRWSDHSGDFL
jgi:hypothetical protein